MAEAKTDKPARPKAAAPDKAEKLAKLAKAKAAKAAKTAAQKEDQPNVAVSWWQASVQFLTEVKQELKKVAWPPRKQALSATGVVLALVMVVSLFLGLVDFVLARVVRLILG